jgi:hypothetical protein
MLLALSALSALSVLMALILRQSGDLAGASALHERALRLQRTTNLIHDQWTDRRVVENPDIPTGYAFTASSVRFYTSSPILAPGWPIVEVTYELRRDPNAPAGTESLIYRERRILNMVDEAVEIEITPDGEPIESAIVLLDQCSDLRIEWYGGLAEVLNAYESPSAAPRALQEAASNPTLEPDKNRWRTIAPDQTWLPPTRIGALRITGTHGKEDFVCALIARDSH